MTDAAKTPGAARLEQARQVADAILYEGYLLYPYRQSAQKNRARFQFGVLMPPAYREVDDSERSFSQTECLLEAPAGARIEILVRFLHLQRRTVQAVTRGTGELRTVDSLRVGGRDFTTWDEAAPRELRFTVALSGVLTAGMELPFGIGGGSRAEPLAGGAGEQVGRLVRQWERVDGALRVRAERTAGPYGALRLRVRLENRAADPDVPLASREDGLRHALIAAHLLIAVPGGTFLSMTGPPEWAAAEVAACVNVGTWPVLAGPEGSGSLMLSSPVILYDHPRIAPESAGELFDATEIDEILTLRTLALTDSERQQARASDPRAAELIDRLGTLPPEYLERLHGAIRYLAPAGAQGGSASPAAQGGSASPAAQSGCAPAGSAAPGGVPASPGEAAAPPAGPGGDARPPWWDPGADTSVSPGTDHVMVSGTPVARGSRVRMRPGTRRADAQDLFLAGREAVVEAVLHDVDGHVHVAVSPVGDPVAELQRGHGRFLYFAPDELEPC